MDVPKTLDCALVEEQDLVSRYIGRKLEALDEEAFEEHYFGCDRCWGEVRAGTEVAAALSAPAFETGATRTTVRRGPWRHPVLLAAAAGIALVAATAVLVRARSASSSHGEPRSALAVLVGDQRPIEPRLAGLEWKPYSAQRGSFPALEASSSAVLEATARIKRAEETNPSPQNVGVVGAASLLLGKPDVAVARLEKATWQAPKDAALQNDLAAAYLVLGARAQESSALFKALSAAERAIELDRSLTEAYFNRALVLEALSMAPKARQAWNEYLARDATSGWANEARRHLASLPKSNNAAAWPSERDRLLRAADSSTFALVEEIVGRYPQSTREYVEQEGLSAWGDAYLAGDREKSTKLLRALAIIAAAHLRTSSDRMLPDVVVAIQEADDRSNEAALAAHARGLVGFRMAKAAYDGFDSRESTRLFRESRGDLERVDDPLAAWAVFYEGVGLYFGSDFDAAEAAFDRLRAYAEARSYVNLAGRAQWLIGLIRAGRSDLGNALHPYFGALSCFERSREAGNVGAVHSLIATAYDNLGESQTAWVHRRKALTALASLGDQRRDYSIFSDVAIAAVAQDLAHSALEFQQAALQAASGWASPVILAEAHLYNALILDRLGMHARMRSSMEEARRQLSAIRDEDVAAAVREQVNATEGEILVKDDPAAAERKLSDALDSFLKPDSKGGRQVTLRLPELYLARGRAFVARGNEDRAEADFRAGIEEFEFFRARQKSYGISYFARSWDLFGEMIRLQSVSRGRPDRALDFVERSRARDLLDGISAARVSGVHRAAPGPRAPIEPQLLSRTLPDRVALVYYAVLEDRLLAWAVTRTRITFSQRPTSARVLALRVAALRQALKTGSPKPSFDAEASALFEDLIRPLDHALPSGATLVFLPDGVLNEVPFAALRDSRSGRYLVERNPLGLTPSGTVFGRSGGPSGEQNVKRSSALVVGNPRFDSEEFPSLARLPESEAEARTVAGLYSDSELLIGEAATRTRFLESAPRHSVVHFAGHAVANAEFPLLSRLVFAPDRNAPTAGSGALFARELYSARFPGTRLVVLAGCHTSSGAVVKGEGVMSLARPFLAAGVPAVVATLWDLEDRASNELFSVFHRRFRGGDEPMEALRRAQLALISNSDPVLRSPKAWAGLQVFVASGNASLKGARNGL